MFKFKPRFSAPETGRPARQNGYTGEVWVVPTPKDLEDLVRQWLRTVGANLIEEEIKAAVEDYMTNDFDLSDFSIESKIDQAVQDHVDHSFDFEAKFQSFIDESNLQSDEEVDEKIADHVRDHHDDDADGALDEAARRFVESSRFSDIIRSEVDRRLKEQANKSPTLGTLLKEKLGPKLEEPPQIRPISELLGTAQRKIGAIWGVIREK